MAITSEVSMSRVLGRAEQIFACMFSCFVFFSLKLMILSKAMFPVLLCGPFSLCRYAGRCCTRQFPRLCFPRRRRLWRQGGFYVVPDGFYLVCRFLYGADFGKVIVLFPVVGKTC